MHSKRQFLDKDLTISVKETFLRMYLFCKVLHDAGTWVEATKAEQKVIHSSIMRLYKFMFCDVDAVKTSDVDLLVQHNLIAPLNLIRFSRLSFFKRLVCKGNLGVLALLFVAKGGKRSWLHALESDFKFIAEVSETFKECKDWCVDKWVEYIIQAPNAFIGGVKKILYSPFASLSAIPHHIISAGLEIDDTQPTMFCCNQCDFVANTNQHLKIHMFLKHGVIHPAHLYIDDVICPVCLTYFHSRHRVLRHLMYRGKKRSCLDTLMEHEPVLLYEEARALMAENAKVANSNIKAGHHRTYARLPAFRVSCPLLAL